MKQLILFLLLLVGITSCDTLYYDSWYYDSWYYRRPAVIIRPDPLVRPPIKPYRHVRPMERR